MTDKQRIDQIAVRIAEKLRIAINDDEAEDFANALAASPEFLEAMLPDGVDASGYISAFAGEKLNNNCSIMGVEISNSKDRQHPIPIFTTSAILAATAPLKAEIERLTRGAWSKEIARLSKLNGELRTQLTTEQAKVKVLKDAIELAADQILKCDYTPARSTLLVALDTVEEM